MCGQSQRHGATDGNHQHSVALVPYTSTYLSSGRSANSEGEQLCRMLMTVQLELCKSSGVSFNRLADPSVPAVELHSALDLECGWVLRIP